MKKSITLTQACDGLVRYKSATGMSPNTIRNYRTTFAKLQAYFGDRHVLGTHPASWVCSGQSILRPAQRVAMGNWLIS